jgi:hypothetical protein
LVLVWRPAPSRFGYLSYARQKRRPLVTPSTPPLIGDLTIEAFSEVVRGTVLKTLADCSVEGKMQGKAKINFDVAGYVTAQFTCNVEPND